MILKDVLLRIKRKKFRAINEFVIITTKPKSIPDIRTE